MQKRALASLMLPLGMAACGEAPLAPEAAPAPEAAVSAAASAPAPTASLSVTGDRQADLSAALSDARERLLPAVSAVSADEGATASLGIALQALSERLAARDAAGIEAAVANAEAALAALPAEQATSPEADAMRLALEEIRASGGGEISIVQEP